MRDVIRWYEEPLPVSIVRGNPMDELFMGQVLPPNVNVIVREQGRAMMDFQSYYGGLMEYDPDLDEDDEEDEPEEDMGEDRNKAPIQSGKSKKRSPRVTMTVT